MQYDQSGMMVDVGVVAEYKNKSFGIFSKQIIIGNDCDRSESEQRLRPPSLHDYSILGLSVGEAMPGPTGRSLENKFAGPS